MGEAPADRGVAEVARVTGVFRSAGGVRLGVPLAVAVDFDGVAFIADASPARVVAYRPAEGLAQEFEAPPTPGFYPTGVGVHGFFIYAVDETGRRLLRFERRGSFRDVLLNFEELIERRRVSPHGLAVDATGRLAVTDIENHQVIVLDNYLNVEVAFGNYGVHAGQMNEPLGVSFASRAELLVADTGNRRVQVFTDGGVYRRTIPPADTPNPMRRPSAAVSGPDGHVYVADPGAERIFVFTPAGTLVRALVPEAVARFEPTAVAFSSDGALFVTDTASQALLILKVM
jgi:sugar lactone lactonase YvrE